MSMQHFNLLFVSHTFALAAMLSLGACDKSSSNNDSDNSSAGNSSDSASQDSGSTDSGSTDSHQGHDGLHASIEALAVVANPAPKVSASATLEVDGDEVKLSVELENCPAGMHGLHIHAGTECGDDGSKALAHWDPLEAGEHGEINSDKPHHAGDAAMIECDADGKATFSVSTKEWNLTKDDKLNPIGQAVILHGLNAAQRIACGVIEADGDDKAKFELSATTLSANPAPDLAGKASWTSLDNGDVELNVELSNCPEGDHGFHIHAGTKCGEDGADAMGHWDPLEVGVHGQVGKSDPHHAGDAGVVSCNADGEGTLKIATDEWTLVEGDKLNPLGQAVIVHDIDPTNRIGCAIIEASASL